MAHPSIRGNGPNVSSPVTSISRLSVILPNILFLIFCIKLAHYIFEEFMIFKKWAQNEFYLHFFEIVSLVLADYANDERQA